MSNETEENKNIGKKNLVLGFGKRLKEAMDKVGKKPGELADELNVGYTTVNNWIREKDMPYGPSLAKIPEILNCSLDYLFTGKDRQSSVAILGEKLYWEKVAEMVEKAESEIWLQLRAGTSIQWKYLLTPLEVVTKNNPLIKIRLLICDNDLQGGQQEILRLIGIRRKAGTEGSVRQSASQVSNSPYAGMR